MDDVVSRLRVSSMSKHYGAVKALDRASLTIEPGSVHALLGANGAGKSTLVKAITGVTSFDEGVVELDGRPVRFASPHAAQRAGIAVVYQDPPLFPDLTVAENLSLGLVDDRRGRHSLKAERAFAARAMADFGARVDVGRTVGTLSAAERQLVAIVRALRANSRLLILDEPTASLTPDDVEILFAAGARYRQAGGSVVFISHRMEEVRDFADTMTIFRDGHDVFTGSPQSLSNREIVDVMLGTVGRDRAGVTRAERSALAPAADGPRGGGASALSVTSVRSGRRVKNVSLQVRAGEVVVLTGLVGSGRTELLECIMGLRETQMGDVEVFGRRLRRRSPKLLARQGVVLIPEDRDIDGLIYGFSIRENIGMAGAGWLSRLGIIRSAQERTQARRQIESLGIKSGSSDEDVAALSGGNRQKVVLGKWLAMKPKIMLLDEPTQGVDVGAKAEIHALLKNLTHEQGLAALVVSSDLEEVMQIADRVVVMFEGEVNGEFYGDTLKKENIMTAAALR